MQKLTTSYITEDILKNSFTYTQYRSHIDKLLLQGKTTGISQSKEMVDYTRMNVHRMNRLDKTTEVNAELFELISNVSKKITVLVLTEAWCGDAAQNIPVLHAILKSNPCFEVKYILRDENLEIMDNYLTNGGRSIPKFIFLDKESKLELAIWGPRPAALQSVIEEARSTKIRSYEQIIKDAQLWYAKDKTQSFQKEMKDLVKSCIL